MMNSSKQIFKIMIMVLVLTSVSGCYNFKPRVGSPWMQKLLREGPEGPTMFKQGWRDGCETGISTTSNAFQRHFYTFKQDPKLAQDRSYYVGWKTSFWYCSRYVMQWLRRHVI